MIEIAETSPCELQGILRDLAAKNPEGFLKRCPQVRHILTNQSLREGSYYWSWDEGQIRETLELIQSLTPEVKGAVQASRRAERDRRAARPPNPYSLLADPVPEQLDLFADTQRWPRKPYCSEDKTARNIRTLASALKRPYIQANPPYLRVWSIYDVDRPGAALAWEAASLPPPSWAAVNRENGHAHLVWGLSAPVLVDSPDMRQAPMRYLCAVEEAFRVALEADVGFSGLITKNPAHPLWRTLRGPTQAYDLGELADWVDLPKFVPRRQPVEEVGLGRNVTVFEWLRQYAYRHIRYYKKEVRNFVLWQSHLNNRALERNGDLITPLDGGEVWQIAKSVSKWTWRRFDIERSDRKFSRLQATRGRLGGIAKGVANEDRRVSARLLAAQGWTQRQIAEELEVSVGSINAWLRTGG